jgi:hypothetical protein
MTPGATAHSATRFPVGESTSVRALPLCMDREAGPPNQDREAGPPNQARSGPGPGRRGTELNPRSQENDICESAVLNHRAINATNTVRTAN